VEAQVVVEETYSISASDKKVHDLVSKNDWVWV
jgi:hypothetical protein